jgi:hypothetical protein
MLSLDILLTVTALILFILAALNVNSPRLGLVPAGLACLTLTLLI